MQFVEGLSDRQAAEAIRSRMDWKYALGLELTDPGFHFSVLSDFRTRLIAGGLEHLLLEALLTRFKERGLLKGRGSQRTDSTHVLGAIRTLNRLETVGETLRAALNSLAVVVPDWLEVQVSPDWFDRYSTRFEAYRLPQGEPERKALGEIIGADGHRLLAAIVAPTAPAWLRELPAVETLRQVWVQQYYVSDDQVHWRAKEDLPPAGTRIESPYDPQARYGNKRSTQWTGYKVHLTETCEADTPPIITHIETTPASRPDVAMTAPIHQALAAKDLLPNDHLLDAGYVDATLLATSQTDYEVTLVGPVRPDVSWQAQAGQGYDLAGFTVDWAAQQVRCPQGQTSVTWGDTRDPWGNAIIRVSFARTTCQTCLSRSLCTRAKTGARDLTLHPEAEQEALQAARQQQLTPEWKARYAKRAGVEGSLSQGVRAFGLRRSRYLGLVKTHLQHLATAAAMNLVRLDAWLCEIPRAQTRTSHFAALRPGTA